MAGRPVALVLGGIGIDSQEYYARAGLKIAKLDGPPASRVEDATLPYIRGLTL